MQTRLPKFLVELGRGAASGLVVFGLLGFGLVVIKPSLFTLYFAGIPGGIMLCTGWATRATLATHPAPHRTTRLWARILNLLLLGIGMWLLVTPAYEGAIIKRLLCTLFIMAGSLGAAGLLAAHRHPLADSAVQPPTSIFPQSHQ